MNADEPLTCPIWASFEEVMTILTLVVLSATPRALSLGNAPLKLPLELIRLNQIQSHLISLNAYEYFVKVEGFN